MVLAVTDKTAKNSRISRKTTATASIKTGPLISDVIFTDTNLETCVLAAATTNGWTLASKVTGLKCNNQAIVTLEGLQHFTRLFIVERQ